VEVVFLDGTTAFKKKPNKKAHPRDERGRRCTIPMGEAASDASRNAILAFSNASLLLCPELYPFCFDI